MNKKEKLQFYRLNAILAKNAQYNMILGERSNGKSYAVKEYCLEQYAKTGAQFAYIRRYEEDIKGTRGAGIFDSLIVNGELDRIFGGRWTNIVYYGRAYYLAVDDPENEGKYIKSEKPIGYAFALTRQETYKSNDYPEINNIILEEFTTRQYYLPDEFVIFMNLLSTIIRHRDTVKIFMLGNTVNKYSPYFAEMGLCHIKEMEKGSIDVYSYGDSALKVAVEFADFPSKQKPSDVYFAFDNPRLNMITGRGDVWEMAIYPHAPMKWKPKNVVFSYFLKFDGEMLQCDIIDAESACFTFVHRKTTPIQNEDKDIIFCPDYDARPNWNRRITQPHDRITEKIYRFYVNDNVYYQDNETGEIVRNYINWCRSQI